MRQMTRTTRTWRHGAAAAALVTATVTASLMAGCTSGDRSSDDGRGQTHGRSQEPGHSESPNPTSAGPVIAVKIDNVPAARPQTGLEAADIVYAEQVEGGLSRLMAIYATRLPEAVGPVRSARESDLELLGQFAEPTLAFSGAQRKLLPLIDRAPLTAEPPESAASGAYYRVTDKAAPHNLYLRPRKLVGTAPGADALTTGFRYGTAPGGGTAEKSRTVRFPSARFTFTWSADRHGWLVSMDGTPTVAGDGERIAAATVVVQYVKVRESRFHDVLGNNSPYTQSVGSGRAQVLRDGRAFDVQWRRAATTDGTDFTTADGSPVNFATGQVWVLFVKA
ncbi:putative lipoprotein YerB precursor [Streptomyces turgidiscabies]|nr:putative lipoprotein YerB precursor [Streptomyces turgidiscabies]